MTREELVNRLANLLKSESTNGHTYRKRTIERLLSEIEAAGWEVRVRGKEQNNGNS